MFHGGLNSRFYPFYHFSVPAKNLHCFPLIFVEVLQLGENLDHSGGDVCNRAVCLVDQVNREVFVKVISVASSNSGGGRFLAIFPPSSFKFLLDSLKIQVYCVFAVCCLLNASFYVYL